MKEQITIRLPVELKEKLQQEADERGYSITELIIFILWDSFSATIHQE
ncbi:MAG TPA: ribbon-helix-helix protein, CopG family [Candidatus Coprocola pullicola]|nr:ribbon-helix-helix protein, CopG family [Candidatus Coprocola pullicola]